MKKFIVKKEDANVRIDRYLSLKNEDASRVAIQRWIEEEKVLVNGKIAKASTTLKIGDIIEIVYFKSTLKVKVLDLNQNAKKQDADNMYEVISVTDNNS